MPEPEQEDQTKWVGEETRVESLYQLVLTGRKSETRVRRSITRSEYIQMLASTIAYSAGIITNDGGSIRTEKFILLFVASFLVTAGLIQVRRCLAVHDLEHNSQRL